jgi:predicted secreted hydrolase
VKGSGVDRRQFLLLLPGLALARRALAEYPAVVPGHALAFPRDYGSHPAYRTEWWYITGWIKDEAGQDYGFQVTFFRSRPGVQEDNPSAFAPKQLVLAHAALADPRLGRLRYDQRSARAGLGLAQADEGNTRV